MAKAKLIEIEVPCPECGLVFRDAFKETELMSEPDIPLTFQCEDCDCEFERPYTYGMGVIALGQEVTVTEHGDTVETDDDEEDEDFEDEDEEADDSDDLDDDEDDDGSDG